MSRTKELAIKKQIVYNAGHHVILNHQVILKNPESSNFSSKIILKSVLSMCMKLDRRVFSSFILSYALTSEVMVINIMSYSEKQVSEKEQDTLLFYLIFVSSLTISYS